MIYQLPSSWHWFVEKNRYSLTLASVPVAVFALAILLTGLAAKSKAKVEPASYLAQVHHPKDTFGDRYGTDLPREIRVRTIPIVRELQKFDPPAETREAANVPVPRLRPLAEQSDEDQLQPASRRRSIRRQAHGGDICQRHRMRKVWVSDKRWRCKR